MDDTVINIGTIGTGKMAGTLGRLWAAQGHQVFFGSRDAEKAAELAKSIGHNARGGTWREAVDFGDVILFAVPWSAAEETVKNLGSLEGKILIDITNPVQRTDAGPGLALSHTTSAAEEIAGWAPGAKVVKAFNSIHFRILDSPQFGTERASSFFCGDDDGAKAVVARLSRDIGFEPVDCGPLANARLLEPLAVLWMQLASVHNTTDIAFKLLTRRASKGVVI